MAQLDRAFQAIGTVLARLWLTVFGLVVLGAFHVLALILSLVAGLWAIMLLGHGVIGIVAFLVTMFFIGLFLMVYVWEPYLQKITHEISDLITKRLN